MELTQPPSRIIWLASAVAESQVIGVKSGSFTFIENILHAKHEPWEVAMRPSPFCLVALAAFLPCCLASLLNRPYGGS